MCKFGIDPLVLPSGPEQVGERVPDLLPLVQLQARDPGQLPVVVREAACLPVVHDQKHVRAMLQRAQVTGVCQVVGHVERHPGVAHSAAS